MDDLKLHHKPSGEGCNHVNLFVNDKHVETVLADELFSEVKNEDSEHLKSFKGLVKTEKINNKDQLSKLEKTK